MPDIPLQVVISAVDEATAIIQKVRGELDGFSKDFTETAKGFKAFGTAITGVGIGLGGLLVATGLTAARVQVLGTVMENVGRVSGISVDTLREQEETIKKLGITTQSAREMLTLFMQGQLDTANAAKIARVAQDLAVIANVNSSDAAKTLTEAIISQSPMLLRNFGIVRDLQDVYLQYGKQLGIVTESIDKNGAVSNSWARQLTDIEKRQSMLNVILEEGAKVSGTYEAAMGDVGKQITSFPRYIEEFKKSFGEAFLPVMSMAVEKATELMVAYQNLSPETKKLITYIVMGAAAFTLFLGPLLLIIGFLPAFATGFAILLGPVGAVILAITALTAVSIALYLKWSEIKDFFAQTWEGIKIVFAEAIGIIQEKLSSVLTFLGFWRDEIFIRFQEIGFFLLGIVKVWAEVLKPIWQPIVEATTIAFGWLKEQLGVLADFVYTIWTKIQGTIGGIWGVVVGQVKGQLEELRLAWENVWNWIIEKIDEAYGKIKSIADSIRESIRPITDIFGGVGEKIGGVAGNVKDLLGKIVEIGKGAIPFEFQAGGMVPGPTGMPVPAIVHGGETIVPAGGGIGNIFNFNFEGAFIGDREAFKKQIIDIINRESELRYLGGK